MEAPPAPWRGPTGHFSANRLQHHQQLAMFAADAGHRNGGRDIGGSRHFKALPDNLARLRKAYIRIAQALVVNKGFLFCFAEPDAEACTNHDEYPEDDADRPEYNLPPIRRRL